MIRYTIENRRFVKLSKAKEALLNPLLRVLNRVSRLSTLYEDEDEDDEDSDESD